MPQNKESHQSMQQLAELEGKIQQAVELLQAARQERETLTRENAHFRRRLADHEHSSRPLQDRVTRLEKERDGIQARLQKLLQQVDSLLEAGLDAS